MPVMQPSLAEIAIPLARRIATAQVDALFAVVTLAVCGAAAGVIILAGTLGYLGFLDTGKGLRWTIYMVACAAAHVLLHHAYRRSRPVAMVWQIWARRFTIICFLEGIGWGWASVGLITGDRFDAEHLVLLVTLGIAAGAVPAYSAYLPAFFALFLPATLPYVFASIASGNQVQQASIALMLTFIGGIGGLGLTANRSFKQLVGLRIQTEELAANLQRQKDIAEQANLAKSSFLAAASHDLRQPVHALGLLAGALRNIAMPAEGLRLLEQIELSTNALDGLFTALLDMSRLDAGIVQVHRRPCAMGALLDRVCGDYLDDARSKGVSLVSKSCAAIVDTDPVLMERILRNLVSNAVRYTEKGRILVGCRRRGSRLAVQVWDSGPGIPVEQQGRIFQEYYQIGNPARDRAKGLGLGLAIVRRLSDLLGCELTLRSQPGRGSCFEVVLPLARDVTATVEREPEPLSGALARGLIIVIDDDLVICKAMSNLLAGWGHDVITAISGEQAMQCLATCPVRPDLIICDYRLQDGENGIALIEQVRSEYNETIPAMLITGDTGPDRLAEAQASGLLLLHKPVSNSKLRAAIGNLIATAEAKTGSSSVR